jgi:DNA polymerase-3 subunit gamma/tau
VSYLVIARKYRPQRFADVVGQEHVTQTLGNAIASGRIAHAYLFAGPRGTGKTTIARIFAKCLNATDGPTVDFPDDDERCNEITEGRALDVIEIDGASNRGIDEIRELRETVNYSPAAARYKVYIIDEVHMLTTQAFNALLKTLEEPPEHVKFLFATTEPEAVLPTILSRCQRFDLRRIPANLIVEHLATIAKKEKVKIDEPALHAIARGADGGMRDAESTLDQLISFCGDKIQEGDVLSMFGLSSQSQVLSLANAVLRGEAETALRELNELTNSGKELGRLVGDLLNHFRNLMVYQVSNGDVSLLEISELEKTALAEQAKLADGSAVSRILEVFTDCEFQLRNAASKKILVEVSLMKAIQAAAAMSIDDVLGKLNELRAEGGEAVAASAPATKPKQAAPTKKVTAAAPPPEVKPVASKATTLPELWSAMMASLGNFTRSYFAEAYPVALEKDTLTIGFREEFSAQMELADTKETNQKFMAALAEHGREVRQIFYTVAEPPAEWASPAKAAPEVNDADDSSQPAPPPKGPIKMDDFKNDPLIKKALEVFKGQIVDVKP